MILRKMKNYIPIVGIYSYQHSTLCPHTEHTESSASFTTKVYNLLLKKHRTVEDGEKRSSEQ